MERKTIMQNHPGIRIDRIPAEGPEGLLFAVAAVLIFLVGVPEVREFLLISLIGGIPTAGLLYLWHNQTRW